MNIFKPCKLTVDGVRVVIDGNRVVSVESGDFLASPELSAKALREATRIRRNRASRARYNMMRDLGMIKTPYGWE